MFGYFVEKFDSLAYRTDLPKPAIQPDELLIEVKSCAVNPADAYLLRGYMPHVRPLPYIPGYDVSGVVAEVGSEVKNQWKVGDGVMGAVEWKPGVPVAGTFAQYVPMKASDVVRKPASISFNEAAAVSIAGQTAYEAVVSYGEVGPNSRVMILGGSGGVGTYAIQFCRARGAAFIATTCSAKNAELVKSLGAHVAIDYHTQDWGDLFANEKDQFDVVLDFAGGSAEYEIRAKKALRAGGRFITAVGDRDKGKGPTGMNEERASDPFKYIGYIVGLKGTLEEIRKLMEAGQVKSVIEPENVFQFKEAPKAFEKALTLHTRGKIVVQVTQ